MKTDKYVGLDVHKDTAVVALAEGGGEGARRTCGTISSDLHALAALAGETGDHFSARSSRAAEKAHT